MRDRFQVTIGIQARTTSQRFPKKILAQLGEKTVLEWVLDACSSAASQVNQNHAMKKQNVSCNVAVCIPTGDPVKSVIPRNVCVVEGSENDVLGRYHAMANRLGSDSIVRITSDCPFITDYLIFKHIAFSVMNDLDYLSNVDEECRTSPDGFDCEVISRNALNIANSEAVNSSDREHVTTYLRKNRRPDLRYGTVLHRRDDPDDKLSVDTPSDLEKLNKKIVRFERARKEALNIYGEGNVFFL